MGENDAALKDLAAQLAAVLQVQGEKGREEWSQLQMKLAQVAVAAAGADPTTAIEPLLQEVKHASCFPDPAGNSDAEDLVRILEKRIRDMSKDNPDLLNDLVSLVADKLNMTPLCNSDPIHMIDADSNFCNENVHRVINSSSELSAPDAPYSVISIVGAQSSGKSFLLNRLFGTRFPEMNSQGKRSQTTRGIMMSRCIGPSLILLDVEGFDRRERGEDTLFEKQAALFALTVSDLMMVNIQAMDIGRRQGGADELFTTIFQERTKLPRGITKLLVVLRCYNGEPSLEIMRSDVLDSLEKIWTRVNLESERFHDYIEVNIVGLPDKFSPKFPEEVTVLRKLLSNNITAKEPAGSFSVISSRFWDTIKQNNKLDIPSHKVAVAKLICQQLVKDTLKSINSQEKYKLLRAEQSVWRFKEISHELLETNKAEYNLRTKMYDPDVRDQERQYLVDRLNEIFKNDSMELIWKFQENILAQFRSEFDGNKIKNMKPDEYRKYLEQIVDAWIHKFMSPCEDVKVIDADHLRRVCGELENKLKSRTNHAINVELARIRKKKANKVKLVGAVTAIGVSAAVGSVVGVVKNTVKSVRTAREMMSPTQDLPSAEDGDLPSAEDSDLPSAEDFDAPSALFDTVCDVFI